MLKDNILKWFATGRVDSSSKAMAAAVVDVPARKDHPVDLDDLNRCLLLLERVPEIREHWNKVAALSEQWETLVTHWDELEQCFINEVGMNWCNGRRAPRTSKFMKELGC